MIARQGMAIELGGVLFLFAGGLLAQQRWSLPFALYLCAWALLALVHFCVPVTAAAAPAFAASTAAPASATPTVSSTPRHGGPTAAAAAMPVQVKTASPPPCCRWSRSSPASSCCPPGSRAWASMRPAPATSCPSSRWWRWAARRCCRRWAVAPAAAPCWSPRCWPTRPPTAVSPWRSRPRNGLRCWREPCCMDWDSACRFRCSTTWSSNIAPTARGPVIWRTCPWPSSAASACLPSWNSCPAGPASYSPAPA